MLMLSPIPIHDHTNAKIAFGRALGKDDSNPFMAALSLFGNAGKALWMVNYWLTDPLVIEAKEASIAQKVVIDRTPTRNELVDEIRDTIRSFDDQKAIVAGYKLLADMLGITGPLALKAPNSDSDILPVLQIPSVDENPNIVFLDDFKSKTA